MDNYKIKINIELAKCDDVESNEPLNHEGGGFSMVIGENDAVRIDKCENAVLRTVWPAIRGALSSHLSEVSKKKLLRNPVQEK